MGVRYTKPHKMCKNVSVNNFLSTKDNYLKLLTITHNDILFPTVPLFLTRFYDDVIFWRHDRFFNFLRIMSNLARYSGWNICHVIKTGKYVNLHCLTFQNLQTELKYHDYSSTSCILKRTRFKSKISKIMQNGSTYGGLYLWKVSWQ